MKKLVVLTGAGISAESGIQTFRAADGLWEKHRIEDVASPFGWQRNPEMVLDFYNQRRRKIHEVEPNEGHTTLAALEEHFEVHVITQNIDDLHERAGSSRILHLHGEILKSRSTLDPNLIYDCAEDINMGDLCEKGSQLRPHIVWFGEAVPMIERAIAISSQADIFAVIGTSMAVYPAASLIEYVPSIAPKFLIDPSIPAITGVPNLIPIESPATVGVPLMARQLRGNA